MNVIIVEPEKMNKDKQLFTDAFNICWELLKEKNYYLNDRQNVSLYSDAALIYGENMFEVMVVILKNIITSNINNVSANDTPGCHQTNQVLRPVRCTDCCMYDNVDAAIDAVVNSCNSYGNINEEATDDAARNFEANEEGQDIVNRNYNEIPKILNYGSIATTSSNDNNLITLRTNELIANDETDPLKRDDMDTDIEIKNEPIDFEEFIGTFNTQNDKSKDNPHDQRDKNDSDVYKYKLVNDYVHTKCFEHNNSGYRLTDEVVRNFGFEAVDKLNIQNFQFTGSITWLRNFKDSYNITGEYSDLKINDLPKKDENISTNSIEKICENPSATDSINIPNNTITISRENLEKKMENAICYEKKVLLVDLSYKNPTWSVKKLRQKSGSSNISSVERLEKWRSQLKIKKTKTEMFQLINHWVYKKIIDYENKNEITDELIEQWSIEAKKKFMFKNLHLSSSSNNWLKQFKENFESTCHYFDLKINPDNGVIEESSVKKVHIPHELRVKVVKLSNDKPSWNIDVLKDHTDCVDLKNDKQLDDWKRKIKKEQSIRDKYDKIYNFIYDKCCSHKIKRKYKKITRKMLIDWRDEAKNHLGLDELPDVEFSPEWISKLKKQFFVE